MAGVRDPFAGPQWDSADVMALRAFLSSESGKRLVHRLRNDRPDLKAGVSLEEAALSGQRVLGYEECVANLFEYLQREVLEGDRSEQYPSLDRDELWPPDLQPQAFGIPPSQLTPAVPQPVPNEADSAPEPLQV